jgi:hypothetical protein
MKADDLAAAGLVALTDGFRTGASQPVVLESHLDGAAATSGYTVQVRVNGGRLSCPKTTCLDFPGGCG